MMFCWPARINSGSARFIAWIAASRSPFAIASSTIRTEPRIMVRRDLLTAVRRAILRVAFLAEVVLAMVSTYPSAVFHRERPAGGAGHSIARVSLNVFPVVPENTTLGANRFARSPFQRTAAAGLSRRHWRSY